MQQRESDYRSARLALFFFCLCLLAVAALTGCSISGETVRASKIADQQACLYGAGSYLRCPHTPETVR